VDLPGCTPSAPTSQASPRSDACGPDETSRPPTNAAPWPSPRTGPSSCPVPIPTRTHHRRQPPEPAPAPRHHRGHQRGVIPNAPGPEHPRRTQEQELNNRKGWRLLVGHQRGVIPDARGPEHPKRTQEQAEQPQGVGTLSWPPAGTSTWPLTALTDGSGNPLRAGPTDTTSGGNALTCDVLV